MLKSKSEESKKKQSDIMVSEEDKQELIKLVKGIKSILNKYPSKLFKNYTILEYAKDKANELEVYLVSLRAKDIEVTHNRIRDRKLYK